MRVVEESMEKTPKAFVSNVLFLMAGSPKFRVYDANFELGRPVNVEIGIKNEEVLMPEN